MNCAKCGAELPEPAATGRPRRYCSVTCRRLAELERLRLTRILERLEQQRVDEEFTSGIDLGDWKGRTRAQRLADTRRAIADIEARLRELIEDEG